MYDPVTRMAEAKVPSRLFIWRNAILGDVGTFALMMMIPLIGCTPPEASGPTPDGKMSAVVDEPQPVAGIMAPRSALSQTPDQAHIHASEPVSCTTLSSPPWSGLSETDRLQVAALRQAMSELDTPEAARAAGFNPALGDIPGMGVHYVHMGRSLDGVWIDAPDHLMFASIDGREQLVGAAYVFIDVPESKVPIPFESDLARWHDHPEFGDESLTLHMLHVWFVPSSNGPFAGLNFWLPYRTAGIEPPSSCWMADEADADRIRNVSFALVPPRWGQAARELFAERQAVRGEMLAALDAAARAVDRDAWVAAADRFLADLTASERSSLEARLRASRSAEREAVQN